MPSAEPAPSPVAPPARLGRYELIGHLATGGMAEIHLARLSGEAGFSKVVVVKRLLPELVASPAFVAMFLDEGKLVARLDHPNICEVFELGREGAEYFLAMPYLDGVAVHELIARPREPERIAELRAAAAVIAQACAGLHHAHELRDADGSPAHLVHRDVSPSNLFVTAAGIVKVLDFGIAKVRGAAETEAGTIKGKTQYMAPEQLLGEPLDRRADVFALGIVAFELATHQRLFKRASDYLSARAILEEPIPRADEVDPAVPAPLADAIARALARDREARFATAADFGTALDVAMKPHGGLASHAELAAVVIASDELTQQRTRQQRVLDAAKSRLSDLAPTVPLRGERTALDPPPRRHSRVPWIAGVAALVAIAVVTLVLWRRSDATPAEPAPLVGPATPSKADANPGASRASDLEARDSRAGATDAKGDLKAGDSKTDSNAGDVKTHAQNTSSKPGDVKSGSTTSGRRGTISIDSKPFATIYIDGARIDVTPILGYSLPAGPHRLRAVLKDGRARELTIDIPAGKAAKPITLAW